MSIPSPLSLPPSTDGDSGIALRCQGLHRYLGHGESRVHVLKGVSFEAHRGQVYAIVGPSGCGKSTLLYQLGLLDQPDDGQIWINRQLMSNNDDTARTAARGEHIGFVFRVSLSDVGVQRARECDDAHAQLGRLAPAEMAERARILLAAVGLGEKTHRLPTQLSGGEQQRVAIACALANQPAILLADEPTGNLDHANSTLVFDLLMRLAKENGQAIVLVTHNPDIANRCDVVRPMRDGLFV